MFNHDDIYSIWLSVAKDMFKENEFGSLKVWEEKLVATNYKALSYSMKNIFYYGIIYPWQMSIIGVLKSFSLDSTFGISSRSNMILYSFVVRHSDTGKGASIRYMVTNDQPITTVLS
jgi:hypothetical protein